MLRIRSPWACQGPLMYHEPQDQVGTQQNSGTNQERQGDSPEILGKVRPVTVCVTVWRCHRARSFLLVCGAASGRWRALYCRAIPYRTPSALRGVSSSSPVGSSPFLGLGGRRTWGWEGAGRLGLRLPGTGERLALGQLGRGHLLHHIITSTYGAVVFCPRWEESSSKSEPEVGLDEILRCALAQVVHQAESCLGVSVPLVRRASVPAQRFGRVLRYAPTVGIHQAEIVLGGGVSLVRRA